MRSSVSSDAKIDKAAAEIYRRESEKKRASVSRTERDKVSEWERRKEIKKGVRGKNGQTDRGKN